MNRLVKSGLAFFCAGAMQAEIILEQAVSVNQEEKATAINVPAPESETPSENDGLGKMEKVLFLGGDVLGGNLIKVSSKDGLLWRHHDVEAPINFSLQNLREVKLGKCSAKKGEFTNVSLTNGDVIKGNVVSLDDEMLTLDTWFGGQINIKRCMVANIAPGKVAVRSAYEGPNRLDEWTVSGDKKGWSFKNGALYNRDGSSAAIHRKIELPEKFFFNFTLKTKNSRSFELAVASDSVDMGTSKNAYVFQVNDRWGSMYRYYKEEHSSGNHHISSINYNSNEVANEVEYQVMVDRKSGFVVLVANNKIIGQATDNSGKKSCLGNNIVFRTRNSSKLKISNIRAGEWDGKLKLSDDEPKKAVVSDENDIITFVNGDKIQGNLVNITAGFMNFKNEFGQMNVPVEKVAMVMMNKNGREEPRKREHDVTLIAGDGKSITINLEILNNGSVQGSSDAFGTVALDLAAFSRLKFNIYDERANEGEEDDF